MHTIGLLLSNAADQRLLTRFLGEQGYEVRAGRPTPDALVAWSEASLLIVDTRAARYYGDRLLALKRRVPSSYLPLLIATRRGEDPTPWVHGGFDDVLRLPVRKAELVARLRLMLRLRGQVQRRYHTFFEATPVGIYRVALDGELLLANPALLKMAGVSSVEALAGHPLARRVGPGPQRPGFSGALERDGQVRAWESQWETDRGPCWLRENALLVQPDHEPAYCEGTVEDITAQKEAECALRRAKEAAEAADRAKRTFLANMSHEIRTPLTNITGFTSFLAKGLTGSQQRYVSMIERNGKRLMGTLDALLMLARLEADEMKAQHERLAFVRAAREAAHPFAEEADQRGLSFTWQVEGPAAEASVQVDPEALGSVLRHLFANAVKFTQQGAVRTHAFVAERVTTDEDLLAAVRRRTPFGNSEADDVAVVHRGAPLAAPAVCLGIVDTGRGVDPAFARHLFEPFQQESQGMARSYEGSGLGLSIALQLTEVMGGTIGVVSRHGTGSAFFVAFPLVEVDAGSAPAGAPRRDDRRILVVEDNPDTAVLVQELLREVGTTTLVHNAHQALDVAHDRAFDLILIDINLRPSVPGSGEDGVWLMKQLQKRPAYENVPLVAMTAYALPGDREALLREGFDAYIGKPFTMEELQAIVQQELR